MDNQDIENIQDVHKYLLNIHKELEELTLALKDCASVLECRAGAMPSKKQAFKFLDKVEFS